MEKLKEENLKKFQLIDRELELVFNGEREVSEPDVGIKAYYFKMQNAFTGEEMGFINIKKGMSENIKKYRGNIGFEVFEKHRGNNYSSRSCKLLVPIIKFLGFEFVYITCNSSNYSSKKNIEKLGARLLETLYIDENCKFSRYYEGESRIKLHYIWELGN